MSKQKRTPGPKNFHSRADMDFTVTEPIGLFDFLLLRLSNKSRNYVKSLLTRGEIFVDGRQTTQYDTFLKAGQKIRIKQTVVREKKEKGTLEILYEDSDLIVVNKPAGLLTIASDKEKTATAYHLLTDYVRQKDPRSRIFIVHRLDRDTSGILMFAKNEQIKLALQDNWSELVSDRGYVAVVEGQLKEKSGQIRSWLKQTKTLIVYSSHRKGDGLEAITDYQVIHETPEYSFLEIHLQTGRKNQIRVHMKDIGHSVVGDKKYGSQTDPLKRLGLHAYKLEFKHPFTGNMMCFQTKIPKKFTSLFEGTYKNK